MATPVHPRQLAAFASAAVLLFSLSVNSLLAQTAASDSTVVRGTVINSKTHEPIGRALVYSPDNRFATMTDDRGRFQFNLPAINYTTHIGNSPPYALLARKPGFLPYNNGQQLLQPGTDLTDLTISLVPEALIVGHVQIPDADGFDRIQVGLYRRTVREGAEHWDSAGLANARSDGEFRFSELQPGSYKLITHELLDRNPLNPRGTVFGFPPVYYPSGTDFSTAAIIQLAPGITFVANISPVHREYYPVKIKVANPPADNGVGVQVWPQGHPGPGFALGYNPMDQTIQGSLPDGYYAVQVSSFGQHSMNGSVNLSVKGAPAEGQTISLFPNVSIPINIRQEFQHQESLEQLSSIGGTSNPNGWLRSVNVNLVPMEDYGVAGGASMRHPQNPDEDSPPVVENVHPGQYKVLVYSPVGFASSITSGGTDLSKQALTVAAGGSSSPIEIILRDDGVDVDGVVEGISPSVSSTTVRQSQGQVYFIPSGETGGQLRMAWVTPEGRFEMRQLPPGSYRVMAFPHAQELEYTSPEVMRKFDSKSQIIRVEPGQKEHLQLQLATPED